MFDTNELNDKLVSELREIARNLGVVEADDLRKAQLISKIVEQEQLIEAARQQQNAVNTIYAPKQAAPAAAPEKARKRIRTIKNSNEPRVEVPLDDTNLFDMQDDEPAVDEGEDIIAGISDEDAPISQDGEDGVKSDEEESTQVRLQKFERRINSQNAPQKVQEPQ